MATERAENRKCATQRAGRVRITSNESSASGLAPPRGRSLARLSASAAGRVGCAWGSRWVKRGPWRPGWRGRKRADPRGEGTRQVGCGEPGSGDPARAISCVQRQRVAPGGSEVWGFLVGEPDPETGTSPCPPPPTFAHGLSWVNAPSWHL